MKRRIKAILSASTIIFLKETIDRFHFILVWFFSKSGFLSSFYYLFLSRNFQREHRAVLSGMLAIRAEVSKKGEGQIAILRRNIHRLEKGLVMKPRRKTFGLAYIEKTVECFQSLTFNTRVDGGSIQWAADVLTEYFSVVDEDAITLKAKQRFENCKKYDLKNYVPYKSSSRIKTNITTSELDNLFRQRRSTRWFEDKPVEIDKVKTAINMASYAPSACNRQPFYFYIANGSVKATSLADLAIGTAGFSHNLQCIIAVVGDLSSFLHDRDRHLIYIDSSLASMQLMLALETMGLSSCPLNWPDIDSREAKIAKQLKLQPFQRVVMLMAVGYALDEGLIPYSQKMQSDRLLKEI